MSDQRLAIALQSEAERNNDPDISDKICDEIKNSVIFNYNWQDLLQSAPVAVSATAACYVAGFSDAGKRVKLEMPLSGSFEHLQHQSLSANLITCGDIGRMAFTVAETEMASVKDLSKRAQNQVSDIIESIADPPTARKLLKQQMSVLQRQADDCYESATFIDKKFDEWLLFVCELHAACVGTDSSNEDKLRTTQINLAVQQTRHESQKSTVAEAEKASNLLGKQLDVASEAFKKASDEFPTGWDILGQEIVQSLAEAATTALAGFTQAMIFNMNPLASIGSGSPPFASATQGQSGYTPSKTDVQAPPATKRPIPPESTDPAYGSVGKDIAYLNTLNVILNKGKDDGVDWDSLSSGSDADATKTIQFVASMLNHAHTSFKGVATSESPSKDLLSILETSAKIAEDVHAEAQKGLTMGKKFPEKDSEVVKDWQTKFADKYKSAQVMVAVAKSLPGATPGALPLMANPPDPAVQIAQTNAKSAAAQAKLEAAQNRLHTTQETFLSTQQTYLKSSQLLAEQQNQLTQIEGELTRLAESRLSLTEIKAVLESCIKLIVNIKQNIAQLCKFFKAISKTVEAVVKHSVRDFLEQVAIGASADGNVANLRIADYTLTDLQASMLFQAALSVRAQFSVLYDIASMWVELSGQHIMPGVGMLDELSLADPDPNKRQALVAKVQKWSREAIDGVKRVAGRKQKEIEQGMGQRVSEIQAVTKRLPATEPMVKAIAAGVQATATAAQTAIVANAAAKPLNRFAPKRL